MMKNCVFRVYVTNLGLYNDGYLVGEWVSFPLEREGMTFDESINDMLKRIKVDGKRICCIVRFALSVCLVFLAER